VDITIHTCLNSDAQLSTCARKAPKLIKRVADIKGYQQFESFSSIYKKITGKEFANAAEF
jgi:hypothetical protein